MPTPSVHDPRGIVAAETASLGVLMFALAGVVFALVLLLLLLAVFRARPGVDNLEPQLRDGRLAAAGGTAFIVFGGAALPIVVLGPLLVFTLRSMAVLAAPSTQPALTVQVVSHQYWWELRYPQAGVVSANEIHIPIGRPVELQLRSADVIHSFWVPQLMGKHDLVPGRQIETWLEAAEPGVYRGECAELCGVQHARMYFLVIAEPPDVFDQWLAQQQQPAARPPDQFAQRGAGIFAREGCITCHAIRFGADAQPVGGLQGPDLTHVGSRRTLASGILDNNMASMAGWIRDAQALKPGSGMPAQPMDDESLRSVAAYLMSLE